MTKLISALLIFLCFCSVASAITPTVNIDGDITTFDITPNICFFIIGNEPSYSCNLLIGEEENELLSGEKIVFNNTNNFITCNRTLEYGTYNCYISMYNSLEKPPYTNSLVCTLTIKEFNTFGSVTDMLTGLADIFVPAVEIIIKTIPILIIITVTIFITGLIKLITKKNR